MVEWERKRVCKKRWKDLKFGIMIIKRRVRRMEEV
jgi:hypothetical protein